MASCTAAALCVASADSSTFTCSASLTILDFQSFALLLSIDARELVLLLGQSGYLVLTRRVPIEHLGEPVEHVDIELDLCPGVLKSVRSLLPIAPIALVSVFQHLLVEQPSVGTHPVD